MLRYPTAPASADSEGVTLTDDGAAGGIYVSSERTAASGREPDSMLRYDVDDAGDELIATKEWNLTAGSAGCRDERGRGVGGVDPRQLPRRVGLHRRADGRALRPDGLREPRHRAVRRRSRGQRASSTSFALDQTSGASPAWRPSPAACRPSAAMHWDATRTSCGWSATTTAPAAAACSRSTRGRRHAALHRGGGLRAPDGDGQLQQRGLHDRAGQRCVGGFKPVYWADDDDDDGHALRRARSTARRRRRRSLARAGRRRRGQGRLQRRRLRRSRDRRAREREPRRGPHAARAARLG